MDSNSQGTAPAAMPYNIKQYKQIWQRVAPSLTPYPNAAPNTAAEENQKGELPDVKDTSCCMGATAEKMLETIKGFIENELSDHRYYIAMARQAPAWARQTIRAIAMNKGEHAKILMTAYYLITGCCYQPSVCCDRIYIGPWCPALRERYHMEACGGRSYLRAAESTADPCLSELLRGLSDDEYRHARELMELLEHSLRTSCTGKRLGI